MAEQEATFPVEQEANFPVDPVVAEEQPEHGDEFWSDTDDFPERDELKTDEEPDQEEPTQEASPEETTEEESTEPVKAEAEKKEGDPEEPEEEQELEQAAAKAGDELIAQYNKAYDKGQNQQTPEPQQQQQAQPAPQPTQQKTEPKTPLSEDEFKSIFNPEIPKLNVDDMPDGIKDYVKEYPDDAEAIQTMAGTIAKEMVSTTMSKVYQNLDQFAVGVQQYVDKTVKQARGEAVGYYDQKESQKSYFQDVTRAHTDAEKIVQSPEFSSWKEKQPNNIKVLHDSPDSQHGILMLDLYKKSIGEQTSQSFDNKQDKKFKKVQQQMTETSPSGTVKPPRTKKGSDGFASAFEDDSELQ